jgi:serine/threonine-protein kinase
VSLAQLRQWFDQCIDLPETERMDWLARHVPDAGARAELAQLLAADSTTTGFLDHDAADHIQHLAERNHAFAPPDLSGMRLGAFRLLRRLGQGGQATVYLAEREGADFRQTVAVKLLRRGLHDAAEHRLFQRERHILARLEHPDIARLIDGGVSTEGVPYLAMEYVDGVPIDSWCREQALDLRARVGLFARLCAAVDAAHRALIVHRDLKPSNVLVTRSGQIKVLDFGIARLLDEEGDDATITALRRLTPGYAAPEQLHGTTPTLATDVYALGVVLAELIVGTRPGRRQVTALPADTPRDLVWIVGKACAQEAAQRYRSAAELGEDLQRWLVGAPVRAHPPSRAYRLRRFVGRHRGGVAGAALFMLTLAAASVISALQAQRAQREAQRANTAAATAHATQEFLVSMFEAAKGERPDAELPSTRELLRQGLEQLRSSTDAPPAVRQELLGRFVDIHRTLGDLDLAETLSAEQLEHARANFGAQSREYALALVESARNARERAQWAPAEARLREALPLLERSDAQGTDLANALADLGALMTETSRYDAAPPWYARAGDLFARHCARGNQPACRDRLSVAIAEATNLGMRGDKAAAYERHLAGITQAEQSLGPHHLITATLHYNAAAAAAGLGNLDAAVKHAQTALDLSLQLGATGAPYAVKARNVLALAEARRGHFSAAAAQLTELVAQESRSSPKGHDQLALFRCNLADQLIELGRFTEAQAQIDDAHAWVTQQTPVDRFHLARTLEQSARIALAGERGQAAFELSSEALRLRRQTPDQRVDAQMDTLLLLARSELQRGHPDAALAAAREILALLDKNAWTLHRRAELAAALERAGAAAEAHMQATAIWQEAQGKTPAGSFDRCRIALRLYPLLPTRDLRPECSAVLDALPETAPLQRDYRAALLRAAP